MRIAATSILLTGLLSGCVTPETAEKDYNAKVSEVVLAAAVDAERSYDYQTAVRHFATLYENDRTDPNVVRDLARNLRYAGSPKQAIALLKRTMTTTERAPALMLELAKAQLAASDLAAAQETLTEAKTMESLTDSWQYHLVLGIYRDRLQRFTEAREAYEHALELSPDNVGVLNNLALSFALSGDIDKGIEILQKVVDDETATHLTRQNLALLYGIKGDMEAAGTLAKRDLPRGMAEENLSAYRSFHE